MNDIMDKQTVVYSQNKILFNTWKRKLPMNMDEFQKQCSVKTVRCKRVHAI